ncbi:response regulator [Paenibacillus flagellatus]|uniref:DNA-binding response regulator n=1 Tax=Paenibacillus flagellatus TaxID=2211139 RepID=A0A2V5JXY7_9BACL|nr:response regulator [Paenibacillus flagellatus]PYI51581.1 hypothetical protein DLM86_24525 [Paenibacillus flagellatus]
MIKILLVDDEGMTRGGLKEFVDWDRLGIEVAAEAADGVEALAAFERCRPDIVLTDVRMPRLDGLEMAARLREAHPDCQIVFMSGYSDTPYLKKAIKLNAVDYIEKPVQIGELEQLLARIAERIRQDRERRLHELELVRQLSRSLPERTEGIVRRLLALSSPADPDWPAVREELERLPGGFPVEGSFVCCVFTTREPGMWPDWRETAHRLAEEAKLPMLAAVLDGRGVAVLAAHPKREQEKLSLWLNRMTDRAKAEERGGCAVGVGEERHHPAAVRGSFEQAERALLLTFYRGWNTVLAFREFPQTTGRAELRLFDKRSFIRFEEALRQQDIGAAAGLLDETVNELLLYPQSDVGAVRRKLFRWYVALAKAYPESMWEFEKDELWASVFVSGELYTIRGFMIGRMNAIREARETAGSGPSSDKAVIREALQYIHKEYAHTISISAIAEHVYLTPTYLCILFKKEQGVSIHDYITRLRIEKAKRLLADRKLKLYEVAQRVGYQDANYFAKVFRKAAGMNPSEFRESVLQESI